jgi:DNA processing protein
VEAPVKSGALITARFALEQNRDIWVASAGTLSPLGEGTAKLVEDGAPVIKSGRDILEEWGIVTSTVTAGAALGASLGAALGQTLGIEI